MRYILTLCLILLSPSAYAACTSPGGVEGEIIFNRQHKVLQYCNGDIWIGMGMSGNAAEAQGNNGEIQFATNDQNLGGDANLVWDNTLKQLVLLMPSTANHYPLHIKSLRTYNNGLHLTSTNSGHTVNDGAMLSLTSTGITLLTNKESAGISFMASAAHDLFITGTGDVGIGTTTPNRKLVVIGNSRLESTPVSGNAVLSIRHGSVTGWGDNHTHFGYTGSNGSVVNYIRGDSTDINTDLRVTGYTTLTKRFAGAPPAADCTNDYIGRMAIDTTNNRLYICMGATRSWDYIALTN